MTILVELIIIGLWGMIILNMLISDSLVWNMVGVVFILLILAYIL